MPYMRLPAVCQPKAFIFGNWIRQQLGYSKAWACESQNRCRLFVGKAHGARCDEHSTKHGKTVCFGETVWRITFAYIAYKEQLSKIVGVCKGLTLKQCELLENPNGWCRGQSAAKPSNRNVQRLSLRGVHSSEWKRTASKDEDIVWSARKHAAARKSGTKLTTSCEHKRWAVNSLGGFMYSRQLSNVLRMAVQPLVKFRQFCDVRDASQQGKKKGDIFTWDVFSDVVVPGGVLTETNTMPETNYTIVQGTLTMTEAGNSVPYSAKLDNLSKLPVQELIQKVLKNDAVKSFDRLAWTQFNATLLRIIPTGGTNTAAITLFTNGTVTGTNSIAYNNGHAKAIVDMMKERNIPAYMGDDYYSLAWPTTLRTFKNNLETIHQYSDTGFKLIMNGEIGRYENTRYVEQTNIAKGNGVTGISVANGGDMVPWVNGLSDWIFFFGNDTVAEAIAVPEEMRGKIPTDYGRSKGVAWYYLGGFGIVHTLASNVRIVKWDSQA